MAFRSSISVFILAVVGCSPAQDNAPASDSRAPFGAEERAEVRAVIEIQTAGFWEAWAAADIDRGLDFFAEEATAVTKTAAILPGLSAIDAAWRPGFATITSQDIEITDSYVTVFGPELASVHQVGTFVVHFTDGVVEGPIHFTYTTVWALMDGAWRIVVAHRTDPS